MSTTSHRQAVALSFSVALYSLGSAPHGLTTQTTQAHGYRVVNVYPHDPDAYTQGLIFRDGFLYESTGLNGRSTLRKVELETGRIVQQHRLDPAYFGEGLAVWNGQLVQLTWT
jgi:glutaminyl-peptide cyclotransferase